MVQIYITNCFGMGEKAQRQEAVLSLIITETELSLQFPHSPPQS